MSKDSRYFKPRTVPVAQKTYTFELHIEAIIRSPKKVGLFDSRYTHPNPETLSP